MSCWSQSTSACRADPSSEQSSSGRRCIFASTTMEVEHVLETSNHFPQIYQQCFSWDKSKGKFLGECWEMKGTDLWIGEVWHALLPIHSNGLGLRANLEVLGPIGVDSWDVHTTRTYFYFQNIFVLNCPLYVHVLDTWYIMSMHIC